MTTTCRFWFSRLSGEDQEVTVKTINTLPGSYSVRRDIAPILLQERALRQTRSGFTGSIQSE